MSKKYVEKYIARSSAIASRMLGGEMMIMSSVDSLRGAGFPPQITSIPSLVFHRLTWSSSAVRVALSPLFDACDRWEVRRLLPRGISIASRST
jgi:hypothetical protein